MGQESEERAAQTAQNTAPQGTGTGGMPSQQGTQSTGQAASEQQNSSRRNESVRISSPEQVDDYIRVTTPGMWVLASAILVLLAAGIIWAYAVRLEMKTTNPDGSVKTEYVKPASFLTDGAENNG